MQDYKQYTLGELIRKEVESKATFYPYDKKMIKNFFLGNGKIERGKKNGFVSYECCQTKMGNESFIDVLNADIKLFCCAYTRKKSIAVKILQEMFDRIERKYGFSYHIEVPNFDYSNAIERKLFMIKYFHPEENHTLKDYKDVLWMYSDDTIMADFKSINDGELSFLGKKINLNLSKNNEVVTTDSTGHPVILVENLTQIVTQLEGLRKMANGATENYALMTARVIWSQLSDYAKKRIKFVAGELMGLDIEFYNNLEFSGKEDFEEKQYFFTEVQCSKIGGVGSVLDFLKNGKVFFIAYKVNGKVVKRRCKFDKYKGLEELRLLDVESKEHFVVLSEDVICAAEKIEEFIHYLN